MNISFDKNGSVAAVLTLKIEKADYADQLKQSLKNVAKRAQVPGFRPGHVPAGLINKMYGGQAKAEAVDKALNDALYTYITDNKVNMLGQPLQNENQKAQDLESQDDFEFIFDIALAPEFEAALTANDTVDYYDIEVSDEEVDTQVKQIAQRGGHPENVESYEERDILRGVLAELDAQGQPAEGGIVVEKASLMPTYFKNDEQKAIFATAKPNDVIVFNPSKAYEGSDAEVAALLKIDKENVGEHAGDFSFQVEEISRFVPAELNQEFFDKVFGEGAVEGEDGFRGKVRETIAQQHVADSDYKFLLDVRTYLEGKVGNLEFPEDLLKRIMTASASNGEETKAPTDEEFAGSIKALRWQLIKEKLVEANEIKIATEDLKATAIMATRFQFAQYGMTDIPEEYLEQYADQMLKDDNQRRQLIDRAIDTKLTEKLKTVVALNHKAVSAEEFSKLVNA